MSSRKQSIKFLIFLICTALLFISVLIFCAKGIKKEQNDLKPANVPVAADLTISTYNNLRDFSASVNNGNTYAGKTVVLANSIDCNGSSLSCIGSGTWNSFSGGTINNFKGVFDGQGYTISNFTLTGGARFQNRTIKGQKEYNYYYYYHVGLFVNIGESATIKNLKISNYSYKAMAHVNTSNSGSHTYHHTDCHYGLVSNYHSNGTISQCWADGSGGFCAVPNVSNVKLQNAIIAADGTEITEPKTTTGLEASSLGGESGTMWYYAEDYNEWPMLRLFINKKQGWKGVNFTVKGGTTPSKIFIPNDANKLFPSSTPLTTIYGQEISTTTNYCHYTTEGWIPSSSTEYSLTFTKPTRTVTVKVYNSSTKTTTTWKTFYVSCGETISVNTTATGSSNKYKACTINGFLYMPISKYYISSINCENGAVMHSDKEIIITEKLKDYNILFA